MACFWLNPVLGTPDDFSNTDPATGAVCPAKGKPATHRAAVLARLARMLCGQKDAKGPDLTKWGENRFDPLHGWVASVAGWSFAQAAGVFLWYRLTAWVLPPPPPRAAEANHRGLFFDKGVEFWKKASVVLNKLSSSRIQNKCAFNIFFIHGFLPWPNHSK